MQGGGPQCQNHLVLHSSGTTFKTRSLFFGTPTGGGGQILITCKGACGFEVTLSPRVLRPVTGCSFSARWAVQLTPVE